MMPGMITIHHSLRGGNVHYNLGEYCLLDFWSLEMKVVKFLFYLKSASRSSILSSQNGNRS
jgi:hypothetical protein